MEIFSTFVDWLFYTFRPRKTIVIIASSMRSGSTLLKALMAEAPDVSHLPETDWFKLPSPHYAFYRSAYSLSDKPIIVLKRPLWYGERSRQIPPIRNVKVIVLIRHVYGVVKSLQMRAMSAKAEENYPKLSKEELINYWCDTYECILDLVKRLSEDVRFVKYEDLTEQPEDVTTELFSFIGSSRIHGVHTYKRPGHFEWKWGSDDGGDKIQTLRVSRQACHGVASDKDLEALIKRSPRAQDLLHRLGYLSA